MLPTPKDPKNKLGSRSFLWMGPADLANYTVQADMLVQEDGGKMPDAGIIASGYELTIRGQNHKLRLDSWASNNYRSLMEVPFEPKPDKWYTLKLSVVPERSSATFAARSGREAKRNQRSGPWKSSTSRRICAARRPSSATRPTQRSIWTI